MKKIDVLIVEDSPTQALQLRLILEQHDYNVVVAENGEQALGIMQEVKPSIVVSDIMMPEMDGYELCQQIKSSEALKNMPVLLLTSLYTVDVILKGLECGADSFIIKPYGEDYLISQIQHLLSSSVAYRDSKSAADIEVVHGGKTYKIALGYQQINNLIFAYETVANKNDKLLETQEDLRKNEKRLREITSALGEGIFVVDKHGRLLFMNPEAQRLLGWTEKELLGKEMHDMIHYQRVDGTRVVVEDCPVHRTMANGDIYRGEDDVYTRKDGVMIPVSYVTAPIREQGEIVASVTAFQDITERKQAEQARRSLEKLQRTFEGTVNALASIAEKRDPYTAGHQQRVAELATAIAKDMGLPEEQVEGIRVAGILHDIGKISVPAEILSKPSQLLEIEFAMIKNHCQHGYDILKTIEFPWPIADMVLQHHERLDGSGYPLGLSGEDILLEARILAVADVVEAMASHRPYRPALGKDQALREILMNRGRLYDPEVVDICAKLLNDKKFKCA